MGGGGKGGREREEGEGGGGREVGREGTVLSEGCDEHRE